MNIRYISNIFRGENLWDFWCVCPAFAKINHYLREDSPLPPRRYCTIFAKIVGRGTYETEKTDL